MADTVRADPTKEFFVSMITRDISLEDCILDLIDNSADGARRSVLREASGDGVTDGTLDYSGYHVDVLFNEEQFKIEDNCGGIEIEIAKKYAFRFGRRPGTIAVAIRIDGESAIFSYEK